MSMQCSRCLLKAKSKFCEINNYKLEELFEFNMLYLPYSLDWNARVLLVSSELLAGVVFEGAFYSRARSIPFSLSVTKFFSKHNNFKF